MEENERVVVFHPEHVSLIETSSREFNTISSIGDFTKNLYELAKLSDAGTFLKDGRIIMCAGFFEIWPGVAEVWVIPSKYVYDYPLFFVNSAKRYVENLADTFKFHRVQTTALDDEKYSKWMQLLGFKCEGQMVQYTHNKLNYCLWARLF